MGDWCGDWELVAEAIGKGTCIYVRENWMDLGFVAVAVKTGTRTRTKRRHDELVDWPGLKP